MKPYYFIVVLFLLLINCRKDQEIITGNVTGKIHCYNQYGFLMPDQPGINVKLFRDTALLESTLTDNRGQYLFEHLSYGKYSVTCEKDLFIQPSWPNIIYNAGGYSPTLADFNLYEIPTYDLFLDSVGYLAEYYTYVIYTKFNGDTLLPPHGSYGLPLKVFAGNTPEISSENYISTGDAYLAGVLGSKEVAVYAILWGMDQSFEQLKEGTIYLRMYPIALGQGFVPYSYNPLAMGSPSNVISFKWDEVAGSR